MDKITAFKCKNCNLIMYPYHDQCLNCSNREFEEMHPSETGKLLTYTVIEQLPWGLDERGRVLGVVEFDNGVKAMGLIKDDNPQLGMKVRAGWGPVRVISGVQVYGLTFERG